MFAIRAVSVSLLIWLLSACSTTPAPVIDRLPSSKNTPVKATISNKTTTKNTNKLNGDWRPDTHVVKKGDTLFSLGLEYGYDYKDIAEANEIKAPYTIRVGQILKLSTLNEKSATPQNKPSVENTDGVSTYPLGSEPSTTSTQVISTTPQTIALSEPKAIREPYSEEALNRTLPLAKPVDVKPTITTKATTPTTVTTKTSNEIKPETKVETKPEQKTENKSNTEASENFEWAWPTKGKVIANFNEAGNKGIDIAGNMGQAIVASAAGKVIYSGSDLRGYGKLVIVKHNSVYLSVYAHNSQILVKEGQQVSRGQKIAEMGNTDSNSVKLHFEIRQQGKSVDPNKFLAIN